MSLGPFAVPPSPQTVTPPRPRPPSLGAGAFVAIAATALVAGGLGGYVGYRVAEPSTSSLPPASVATLDRPEGSVASIVEATLPSVVKIEALADSGVAGTGSGFVIREDGYLLTNNHVIRSATDGIVVVFADGTEADAEVVGTSPEYDLAVLKVDRSGLVPLVLGDSEALVVGDPVIAVGAPLGLDSTVTTGIVSALHRPVQTGDGQSELSFIDAIQTDAAINPGNSGGALLNEAGEVVGVTSAIASLGAAALGGQPGSIGLGFAIPSNQARRTAEQIIATGFATYPVVGVLLDTQYVGEGVKVKDVNPDTGESGVVPGGPAEAAGILPGDVVLKIDGRPVTSPPELVVAIRAKAVGENVTLTVRSDDAERNVVVRLTGNDSVAWTDE